MNYEPRRYRISHVTTYSYDEELEACYNRGLLRPRQTPTQTVLSSELQVRPEPDLVREHLDYFGNHSVYLETRTPTKQVSVTAVSVVQVSWPAPDLAALDEWTVSSAAKVLARQCDPIDFAEFTLPSPLVSLGEAVRKFGAQELRPERPLGQALTGLQHRIFTDFKYQAGVTSVQTTQAELLELKQGVCQDFAHLSVGCLRAAGLPARYVSGYLETVPKPGQEKLRGADATHAWTSVLTPGGAWLDLDPTNDQFPDSRYIITAWGRDFSDVSPLRGVVLTEAADSSLRVAVDVDPLPLD